MEDGRFGGLDATELSRGVGLSHDFVVSVLSGDRKVLDDQEVRAVCEALHASPFDVWTPEVARPFLSVYPPEDWPRYIEPIDDLYEPPVSDFVMRRVEQQADELTSFARGSLEPEPDLKVVVTPYRQVGVIAVNGPNVEPVHDHRAAAAPGTDYFLSFEQLGRPMESDVSLHGHALVDAALPGFDAPPELVGLADRIGEWTPGTTLVRFTDSTTGDEHWIGRRSVDDAWESWDDPATDFPGLRSQVLRPAGLLDPDQLGLKGSGPALVQPHDASITRLRPHLAAPPNDRSEPKALASPDPATVDLE
jgi:hypothetical protein